MEIEQYLYWQSVINSGELIFTLLAILSAIFFCCNMHIDI